MHSAKVINRILFIVYCTLILVLLFLLLPKPAFASWVIDFEPPDFTPPSLSGCYDNPGQSRPWNEDISIKPKDDLSNIWYCKIDVKESPLGTIIPPSYTLDVSSLAQKEVTCQQIIPTSQFTPNRNYFLSFLAVDISGNGKTAETDTFEYRSNCSGGPPPPPPPAIIPWIQVIEGDVHSNKDVNTPGGPGP